MSTLDIVNPPKPPKRSELTSLPQQPKKKGSKKKNLSTDETQEIDPPKPPGVFYAQDEALQTLMKAWRTAEMLKSTPGTKMLFAHAKEENAPYDEDDALKKLPHGQILRNMLSTTAVRWGHFSATKMATNARTTSGTLLNSLWILLNNGVKYLEENEVWELRVDLQTYLNTELREWTGFWDDLTEQPGGARPPSSPTHIALPRKLQLENDAKEMEKRLQDGIWAIIRLLRRKEMGAISIKANGGKETFVLTTPIVRTATRLFKVFFKVDALVL